MAGDDFEISQRHMPDDFLDDIAAADPPCAAAAHGGPAPGIHLPPGGSSLEDAEHSLIQRTLAAHGGNVSATARALGVSRNTIYRKMPHLK
jgi:transcriptional regulator of acetoin/glycerol metabolism